jgi:hypothetical protein
MINEELTAAFNAKPRVDINNIKKMTPGQLDSVKTYGSAAENLLKNKDFALFVHHYKFDMTDILVGVTGHSPEDDSRRLSMVHNIAGIDRFVAMLQEAVRYKNKAVNLQSPADN